MKQILQKPYGLVLLVAAIIISRFVPSSPLSDFLAGLFTGLSLVLNAFYIYSKSHSEVKA